MNDRSDRLGRAWISLRGLAVGDAFGERFFGDPNLALARVARRELPAAPWRWTDDTAMAVSVVETLGECGVLDRDGLAERLARRYRAEPGRGYGGGAHMLLSALAAGADWRVASTSLFGGSGSWGNGGAMRSAPIGAWFADSPARAAVEAAAGAEVTHAHPEGIAGAVAVAVAAAMAHREGGAADFDRAAFFEAILYLTPAGRTRDGIARALALAEATPEDAAAALGNGREVAAFDTVPFCLWVAARLHADFAEALWTTVGALGDRDTTCAIVGGIVSLSATVGPPAEWLAATEALPGT